MKNLISVIISMYNAQEYIEKLLDCLKKQTYKNLEIIIVNDGSTDNSLKIAKEYAKVDKRIKIISIPNNGVSNARNIGIDNSTGEYITFLDADDYIEYDMYEKFLYNIIEKKADVLRGNYIREDINGNVILNGSMEDLSNTEIDNIILKEKLLPYIFDNMIPTYTPLILAKSNLIKDKIKFRTDINMMEDLIFCLELFFSATNIFFYDYKAYHYVYNMFSSSKNRKNIIRNFNDTLKIVSILEKFLDKENVDTSIFNKVYHIYSTMLVKYILRTFQRDDEYKISKENMIKLLEQEKVKEIIYRSDFTMDNKIIKIAGNYIKRRDYDKLYDYGIKVKNICI